MASSYQQLLSWLGSGDSLQPEAPPERRRVAGQAPALSPQQPPRQRAGCERIIVVLVHAVPAPRGATVEFARFLKQRSSHTGDAFLAFSTASLPLAERATSASASHLPAPSRSPHRLLSTLLLSGV